jgi:hypothetical protein
MIGAINFANRKNGKSQSNAKKELVAFLEKLTGQKLNEPTMDRLAKFQILFSGRSGVTQ